MVEETTPAPKDSDVNDLVRELFEKVGAILHNASVYGESHRLTVDALRAALPLREKLASAGREILVRVVEGELVFNGVHQPKGTRFLELFADRLESRGLNAFSLLPGLSEEEFVNLVDVLLAKPTEKGEPDLQAEFAARGLEHVKAHDVMYVHLEEDEAVVKKKEKADLELRAAAARMGAGSGDGRDVSSPAGAGGFGSGGGGSDAGGSSPGGGDTGGSGPGEGGVEVQQVVAFLRGDVAGSDAAVDEQFRKIASDPAKLAELVLNATAIRKTSQELQDGENLGDFLVGCLRRASVKLRREPSAASVKGRKDLRKTVIMLEKEVLQRLRDMSGTTFEPDLEQRASAAFDEMRDSLEIEALAAEYERRAHALERSEKKLLKYVEKHPDAAKAFPAAVATGHPGWQQIKVASPGAGPGAGPGVGPGAGPGAGPGGGPGAGPGGGPGAGTRGSVAAPTDGMGVLTLLLAELDRLMRQKDLDPKKKKIVLRRIEDEVEAVGAGVLRKIKEFEKKKIVLRRIEEPEPVPEEETPGKEKSGKKKAAKPKEPVVPVSEVEREREFLAEIVQELCQLAVALNGAASMLSQEPVEAMSSEDVDILGIVVRSSTRLADLLELLRERVGVPRTLTPTDVFSHHARRFDPTGMQPV